MPGGWHPWAPQRDGAAGAEVSHHTRSQSSTILRDWGVACTAEAALHAQQVGRGESEPAASQCVEVMCQRRVGSDSSGSKHASLPGLLFSIPGIETAVGRARAQTPCRLGVHAALLPCMCPEIHSGHQGTDAGTSVSGPLVDMSSAAC